jgi:Glycosyltransferase family 87
MNSTSHPAGPVPVRQTRLSWLSVAGRSLAALVCGLLLFVVFSLIAFRIMDQYQKPGKFDPANQGYCDFHNGVYFPSMAWGDRVSPYGEEYARQYPVERPIPLFTPTTLLLHWPITRLPLSMAEIAWYVVLEWLVILIALVSVVVAGWPRRWWLVLGVAVFLAASRSGYGTLFTGYFSFEIVLGTLLAIHAGHRTRMGGFGFFLAGLKPTTGIPLAIMMLARGHWRALAAGVAGLALTSAMVLGWLLSASSPAELLHQFQDGQAQHVADPNELPRNTWTRVDLLAVVAKWMDWQPGEAEHLGLMLPLIAVPAWIVWRTRPGRNAATPDSPEDPATSEAAAKGWLPADLNAAVCLLAINVTLYHHYYDLLILAPVILAALGGTCGWDRLPWSRWLFAGVCGFVCWNYLSSNLILDRLDLPQSGHMLMTSVNGVLLAITMLFAVAGLASSGTGVAVHARPPHRV